ncbi:hypothetical protein Moror_10968 [Moniliophthora roreri MCA 2997]|uniref:Hydrophobin n=2 Tax=Moniliophthora roreri TaxID=221103 RepID=V2Y3H7_MONRO|nr:hypothetical protein Moror_10968 [Moniliophthora roreri MCA 2997]KAI3609523.1 hypothetical protein WG66_001285 [Moniliophthora roreri]
MLSEYIQGHFIYRILNARQPTLALGLMKLTLSSPTIILAVATAVSGTPAAVREECPPANHGCCQSFRVIHPGDPGFPILLPPFPDPVSVGLSCGIGIEQCPEPTLSLCCDQFFANGIIGVNCTAIN